MWGEHIFWSASRVSSTEISRGSRMAVDNKQDNFNHARKPPLTASKPDMTHSLPTGPYPLHNQSLRVLRQICSQILPFQGGENSTQAPNHEYPCMRTSTQGTRHCHQPPVRRPVTPRVSLHPPSSTLSWQSHGHGPTSCGSPPW